MGLECLWTGIAAPGEGRAFDHDSSQETRVVQIVLERSYSAILVDPDAIQGVEFRQESLCLLDPARAKNWFHASKNLIRRIAGPATTPTCAKSINRRYGWTLACPLAPLSLASWREHVLGAASRDILHDKSASPAVSFPTVPVLWPDSTRRQTCGKTPSPLEETTGFSLQ